MSDEAPPTTNNLLLCTIAIYSIITDCEYGTVLIIECKVFSIVTPGVSRTGLEPVTKGLKGPCSAN